MRDRRREQHQKAGEGILQARVEHMYKRLQIAERLLERMIRGGDETLVMETRTWLNRNE